MSLSGCEVDTAGSLSSRPAKATRVRPWSQKRKKVSHCMPERRESNYPTLQSLCKMYCGIFVRTVKWSRHRAETSRRTFILDFLPPSAVCSSMKLNLIEVELRADHISH